MKSNWPYAILAGLGAGVGFVLLAQMVVALARMLCSALYNPFLCLEI